MESDFAILTRVRICRFCDETEIYLRFETFSDGFHLKITLCYDIITFLAVVSHKTRPITQGCQDCEKSESLWGNLSV